VAEGVGAAVAAGSVVVNVRVGVSSVHCARTSANVSVSAISGALAGISPILAVVLPDITDARILRFS